jgi:hypothetical protein
MLIMQNFGIYTLANDVILDQLIALLNSIGVNVGPNIPVCVIPFDDRLDRVKAEIKTRNNVMLFQDQSSIDRWEKFACEFASAHAQANPSQSSHPRWYQGKLHRKFVAFDGPFEQFVFFDGDSLAMKPCADVFERLENYDFVFDDWEHAKPVANAALDIPLIAGTGLFSESEIREQLHCSSFFGSKRGIFDPESLNALQHRITHQGEAAWVNSQGWWDDAFLFNYMTLRSERSLFNFTLSPDGQERTGNCANSDPFINIDQVLYNEDRLKPIHRIHYMGYSSTDFARLCQGEDANIRYKDIWLHYRFLNHLEQRPTSLESPDVLTKATRFFRKVTQQVLK